MINSYIKYEFVLNHAINLSIISTRIIINRCGMIEVINCSICPTPQAPLHSGKQLKSSPQIAWIVCKNCSQNGLFKKKIKEVYQLEQRVVLQAEVDKSFQIQTQLQEYKKQFNRPTHEVYDSVISPGAYEIAQLMVNFTNTVSLENPEMKNDLSEASRNILKETEKHFKIITYARARTINEELKKKQQIAIKNTQRGKKNDEELQKLLMSSNFDPIDQEDFEIKCIYTSNQINEFRRILNRSTEGMSKKIGILNKIQNQGNSLLTKCKPETENAAKGEIPPKEKKQEQH